MELKYRGIAYSTTTPAIEGVAMAEPGTFLGARFTRKQYPVPQRHQPANELRFLGRSYLA